MPGLGTHKSTEAQDILHTTVYTRILQMKMSKNQAAKQTAAPTANERRNKRKIRHPKANNLMEIYAYRYLL